MYNFGMLSTSDKINYNIVYIAVCSDTNKVKKKNTNYSWHIKYTIHKSDCLNIEY